MARIIVVDDDRDLGFYAEYARNSHDGLAILADAQKNNDRITELWLDHDLGGDDTIMPVVNWLEEQAVMGQAPDIGTVWVHTANWYAAPKMISILEKYYETRRALIHIP